MNIGRRIKEIYDVDFGRLIEELKMMSRQERMILYDIHSKRLVEVEQYPKNKHKAQKLIHRLCADDTERSKIPFRCLFYTSPAHSKKSPDRSNYLGFTKTICMGLVSLLYLLNLTILLFLWDNLFWFKHRWRVFP